MNKLKFTLLFFLPLLVMTACGDDDETNQDIFIDTADIVLRDRLGTEVTLYQNAWAKSGLSAQLTSQEEFTYLVLPDDAMLVALQANGVNSISEAEPSLLASIINRHTFSGIITSEALTKTSVTNVSGDQIYVSVDDNVVFNAAATVTAADIRASNAIFHQVNFPLLDVPTTTIAGIVTSLANSTDTLAVEFTTLLAALEATGLDDALSSTTSEFTVFAPTDAAFAELGLDAGNIASSFTTEELTEILQFHVLEGRNFTVDLTSGRFYTLAGNADGGVQGLDINVSSSSASIDVSVFGTSSTESVNVLATNGTVHIVDAVIQPEPFIYESLNGTFNLSDAGFDGPLLGAYFAGMEASTFDFEEFLSTEEVYTMWVPRFFNNAVSEPELEQNIKAHIFAGDTLIGDVAGGKITSINGRTYYVTQDPVDDFYWINGRTRVQSFTSGDPIIEDLQVYNGRITNFFDEFIPLPDEELTADSVLSLNSDYSLFTGAIKFLELGSLTDVTYLAVTDANFAEAYDDAGIVASVDSLGTADFDAAVMEEIINNHIFTDVFFAVDLAPGVQLVNRNGATVDVVSVSVDDGMGGTTSGFGILQNDDGEITTISFEAPFDNLAFNGVYHGVSGIIEE